jgi:hypothetical protein
MEDLNRNENGEDNINGIQLVSHGLLGSSDRQLSANTLKAIKYALSSLNSYVQCLHTKHNYIYTKYKSDIDSVPDIPLCNITEEWYRQYVVFLRGKYKSKQTVQNLMSRAKSILIKDYGDALTIFDRNLTKTQNLAVNSDKNLSSGENASSAVEEIDLAVMCALLFNENTSVSVNLRHFLLQDWQHMGRVNEVRQIKIEQLQVNKQHKTLCIKDFYRGKTSIWQHHMIFCHAKSFLLCPVHALACNLILNSKLDGLLFGDIGNDSTISYHINKLLASLSDKFKSDFSADNAEQIKSICEALQIGSHELPQEFQRYTSHGLRKGPATNANSHPQMHTTWVLARGGWLLDHMHRVFAYLCGNIKDDMKVARALSGTTTIVLYTTMVV